MNRHALEHKLVHSKEMFFVGCFIRTSSSTYNPLPLWQRFMPAFGGLPGRANTNKYAIQVYGPELMNGSFTAETEFDMWAAAEVEDGMGATNEMHLLHAPEGKYVVFEYQGLHKDFTQTIQYIYGEWLASSSYSLRDAPHFQLMGDGYLGPMEPLSKEEIWVPVEYKN